ncbi:MAG TPA: hypothetical protein VLX61_01655 [Anaerolineales bacterium]|nr:hypothetical protein [Anaerolineales bacterium]
MNNPSRRSSVSKALVIAVLAVLFGSGGCAIAYFEFMVYNLPWHTYQVPSPPVPASRILHIDYKSTFADPTGDTIYVSTVGKSVYSTTLFENGWALAQANPNWDDDSSSTCAPQWAGAQSDAQIWQPPPVEKHVVDSRGVRFEHSIAIGVRCYVLTGDGHIEVWTREDTGIPIIAFLQCGLAYAFIGALLGVLSGLGIIHLKNRRVSANI